MLVRIQSATPYSRGNIMKVYIGPYTKSGKNKRINIRIDKYDTWSMDSTLSLLIVPMLKQLKKTIHGSPYVDMEDVPENLRDPVNEPSDDSNFHKRWQWILSEMIWAFEQSNKDWEMKFHTGRADIWFQPLDKDHNPVGKPYKRGSKESKKMLKDKNVVSTEMIRGPKDTTHFDKDGYNKHLDRIRNGHRLFGKYFMNLWD